MPSFFSRFVRIGRLPEPLRARLAPEGILHVAERVRVTQRFSARRAFRPERQTPDRVGGVHPRAPLRVAAHLPPLKRPAIDRRWDDANDGPAKVAFSAAGMQFDLDVDHLDYRFRGHPSLTYKMGLPDDVLVALPSRSLAFGVSPDYVFHMLGVRVRT
jgi:hypothetical protein